MQALATRLFGEEAPAGPFAPAPGETVLYRHRRRSPAWLYLAIGAGALVLAAASASTSTAIRPLAAALAVLAAGGAVRVWRAGWLEDLLVTDRRVLRRGRDGAQVALALADVERIEARGTRFAFVAPAGTIVFPHVGGPRRLRALVERAAPAAALEVRFDLACPS